MNSKIYYKVGNKLLIRKSFLNRFFEIPKEIIDQYEEFICDNPPIRISKLIEFNKLPVSLRRLIIFKFGKYPNIIREDLQPKQVCPYLMLNFYKSEINRIKKGNSCRSSQSQ